MRTVLLISVTVLLSLSGIVFAIAEGSPLTGVTLVIALATLFFVDLEEIFAVRPLIANSLGIIAFIAAGIEYSGDAIEARLLSGGHLIAYLIWIFLIQRKETRHFWWLCALSVLQMATASVLTFNIWYGFALVLYCFVATWTLSIFLLFRSITARNSREYELGKPDVSTTLGAYWRGVSRDVDQSLINSRTVGSTVIITCMGLVLSLLFFVLTPRVWIGEFNFFSDDEVAGQALTGFTGEVQLGDIGEILENKEPVFELQLFHADSDTPFKASEYVQYLGDEPLFRGTVMEIYENGTWQRLGNRDFTGFGRAFAAPTVRQQYRLFPIGTQSLFTFGNILTANSDVHPRAIFRDRFSSELIKSNRLSQRDDFEYNVYAVDNSSESYASYIDELTRRFTRADYRMAYQRFLLTRPDDLQRTQELTESLTGSAESDLDKAQLLESYLASSGNFAYSLSLSIEDGNIDPIEDFLFNRREGHCEYFASSMAMMLRFAGIPSRLVSGFKGGNYDIDSGVVTVRQFHAHSWVEAYIDGHWMTFDPTTSDRADVVSEMQQSISSWEELWDSVRGTWSRGVLMSQSQQQMMIYDPLQDLANETWGQARNLLQGNTSGLKSVIVGFITSPRKWFSVQGGVIAFILLILLVAFVWVIQKSFKLIQSVNAKRNKLMRARSQQVLFYERFVEILKRFDIQQSPTQTAKEFVSDSLIELKPTLSANGLAAWPEELVSHFYEVRFGGITLPERIACDIDSKLTELETCLARKEEQES